MVIFNSYVKLPEGNVKLCDEDRFAAVENTRLCTGATLASDIPGVSIVGLVTPLGFRVACYIIFVTIGWKPGSQSAGKTRPCFGPRSLKHCLPVQAKPEKEISIASSVVEHRLNLEIPADSRLRVCPQWWFQSSYSESVLQPDSGHNESVALLWQILTCTSTCNLFVRT